MKKIFSVEREVFPLEFQAFELVQAQGGEKIIDISIPLPVFPKKYSQPKKTCKAGEYFIKTYDNCSDTIENYYLIDNNFAQKLIDSDEKTAYELMFNKVCSF